MERSFLKKFTWFIFFQAILLIAGIYFYLKSDFHMTLSLFTATFLSSLIFLIASSRKKAQIPVEPILETVKDNGETVIDNKLEKQLELHQQIAQMWPKISENIEKSYHKSNQVNLFTLLEFEVVEQEFKKIVTLANEAKKIQESEKEIGKEIKTISENSNSIKSHTSLCIDKSNQIQGIMEEISGSNSELSHSIESFIQNLKLVEEFLGNIVQISKKTKTLSINASIEATKAGIKGSGFAVLAKEIRSLAENTGKYTDSIHELLAQIRNNTQKIFTSMQSNSKNISQGSNLVTASSFSMNQLKDQMEHIDAMIQNIRGLLAAQSMEMNNIISDVNGIEELSNKTKEQTEDLKKISEQLSDFGEESVNQAILFPTQGSSISNLMTESKKLKKEIEFCLQEGLENGEITEAMLFNPNFVKKIDAAIPRFECEYLPFFDKNIQPILQKFKETYSYGEILNITINDFKKFVPVCCKNFMKPLTGDVMIDAMGNFARRFFDNPLVVKINKTVLEREFFLSSYAVPLYKLTLSDLSFAVTVNGKPWGAIRLGFQPEKMK